MLSPRQAPVPPAAGAAAAAPPALPNPPGVGGVVGGVGRSSSSLSLAPQKREGGEHSDDGGGAPREPKKRRTHGKAEAARRTPSPRALSHQEEIDALKEQSSLELAKQVVSLKGQLKKMIKERDSARLQLRLSRQSSKRKDVRAAKATAKQAKNESKKTQEWLPVEKVDGSKDFSWLTAPSLIAVGIRRNMSGASSRGFGLAAGTPLSRQACWRFKFPGTLPPQGFQSTK